MVQSHDNQVTDTTTMIFHMGAMHNAQIKQTGFGNFPVFEICWTPSTDATNSTNTFAVDVFDNYCPSNGMNSYVFKVEVVKPPSYSFKVQNTDSICSGLDIDIQFPPSSPGLNYNWEILDSSKQHSFHSSKLAFEHLELEKGNYYVYLHSNVGGLCYQFYDTLFDVIGSETPKYKINDHFLTGCEGEQRIIGIDSAKKTYSYSWQDGYTGRNRVISLGFDTLSYSIEIQNGSCILRDSIWIYPSPAPDLSRFYEWKDKDSLRLSINNPMVGVKYSWYADFATTPLASGNFVVVDLADSINHHLRLLGENFRCRTEDTFTVLAANRTGFNEALQEGKYSIYPNPFFSKIHIQGPETFRVILFDATGKELIRTQVVHEHFTLDQLQAYSKGIYLLYVEGSDGRSIYRLVKE